MLLSNLLVGDTFTYVDEPDVRIYIKMSKFCEIYDTEAEVILSETPTAEVVQINVAYDVELAIENFILARIQLITALGA